MFLNKVWFHYHLQHVRTRVIFLAIAWALGVLIGFYTANGTDHFVVSTFQYSRPFVGLLFVIVLPLVLTALSLRHFTPLLFIPLAFADAFVFAYCSFCIRFSYGNAGWLVCQLLLFSDSCMAVALLLFWIRNIDCRPISRNDFRILSCVTCLIGCIDYFVISPFVAKLLICYF